MVRGNIVIKSINDDKESPTIPNNIAIAFSNITDNGATLSWGAASDNYTEPEKLKYKVWWAEAVDDNSYEWISSEEFNGTTYNLTGLVPGTVYITDIRVIDEAGDMTDYLFSNENINKYGVFRTIGKELSVGGKFVTPANCNDVLEDGTVSYDYSNKTLTLNNAEMDLWASTGIYSIVDGLKIQLKGNNTISRTNVALSLEAPTTIYSNTGGKLSIDNCSNGVSFGEYSYANTYGGLNINDCTVDVESDDFAFDGNNRGTLELRNACLNVKGASGAFKSLSECPKPSNSMQILPDNYTFIEVWQNGWCLIDEFGYTGHDIEDHPQNEWVTITQGNATGLNKAIKNGMPAYKQGVYNLEGVRQYFPYDGLFRGVYIQDGKKALKKK